MGASDASTQPAIAIAGLAKSFGPRAVLTRVDWSVPSGSSAALLGPRGAGKTTLVRVLLGFSPADKGSVQVFGRAVDAHDNGARARIAVAPERLGAPGWMRVRDLLALHAHHYPTWDPWREQRALGALGVERKKRVGDLDPAERRALGFVLAEAQGARLLVLDEPFRDLDPERAAQLAGLLEAFDARGGRALLLCASDVAHVAQIARHVAVLHAGRLVLAGEQAELRAAVRELSLPLERTVQAAAMLQRAGVLASRTEELRRYVCVRSYPPDLAEFVQALGSQASARELDLGELMRAALDLSSTGTGTAPE